MEGFFHGKPAANVAFLPPAIFGTSPGGSDEFRQLTEA